MGTSRTAPQLPPLPPQHAREGKGSAQQPGHVEGGIRYLAT